MSDDTSKREFKFLSILTGLIALIYVIASAEAFWLKVITWADFSGSVGSMACLLVGYWVRGEK